MRRRDRGPLEGGLSSSSLGSSLDDSSSLAVEAGALRFRAALIAAFCAAF